MISICHQCENINQLKQRKYGSLINEMQPGRRKANGVSKSNAKLPRKLANEENDSDYLK